MMPSIAHLELFNKSIPFHRMLIDTSNKIYTIELVIN